MPLSVDALIVFIRNPVSGKVKSRLAAEIGEQKATQVYLRLLEETFQLCNARQEDLMVYFSDFIDRSVSPLLRDAQLFVQKGVSLGERMNAAFEDQLLKHNKAVLIGSDCPDLSHTILDMAFQSLDSADIVIGPAQDGGYYLIGMKEPVSVCFENISWGTDKVFGQTIKTVEHLGLPFRLLPELRDLDTLDDLEYFEVRGKG